MIIGEVRTFPNVKPDKQQVLKVIEEAAEVFGAWQKLQAHPASYIVPNSTMANEICKHGLMNECADVIQVTCNLIAAFGIEDFSNYMELCEQRNQDRGRYDIQE